MRPPAEPGKEKTVLVRALNWPISQLDRSRQLSRIGLGVICAAIFLSALGVRFLYWQDRHVEIVAGETSLSGVFNRYQKEASRIREEGRILYPLERPTSGDARLLAHPPGYSMLLAAIYGLGDDEYKGLWLVQILCDSASALLIFLIGLELLNWWVGLIAAIMVALSPHLAYYSLLLTPDALAVLPILLSVYLVTRALMRQQVITMMMAGALIGVSCWLTANAMLLAVFIGVAVLLLFEGRRRFMLAAVLVGSTMAVVAPLTIRNFVVFHRFIPLSIQAGLSLVEGIGDYDKDGRFGMPRSDREARRKDVEWNGRPEYARSLWSPDGIERDHTRLDRGLAVVRSNPLWFSGVMLRRAKFMLSYNESRSQEFPFSTATVSPILSEAGYGQPLRIPGNEPLLQSEQSPVLALNGAIIPGAHPVYQGELLKSVSPAELNDTSSILSQRARVSLINDGQSLEIAGDGSEFGDQFASAPLTVRENTDYLLMLPVRLVGGGFALKVTSSDRRTALAVSAFTNATLKSGSESSDAAGSGGVAGMRIIQIPFASGNRTEVRLVLSNNGAGPTPVVLLGTAEIYEAGPTPYVWTGYARSIIRSIQRKYTTLRVLTLVVLGIALLLLARRGRALVILLVVPVYYLTLQSPLHTEYRYTLAIHYFLFVMAATTLYYAGGAAGHIVRRVFKLVRKAVPS